MARVAPAYTLDKRARSGSFTGPEISSFSAEGETVYYTYDIRNVGSVRIDNLQVSDDRLGNVSCAPTSIGVGESATCQAAHVVTQEEFDDQVITNVAQATGDPEFGQLGTLSDTVTLTGPGRSPDISIVKTPKNGTYSTVGQTISYGFVVTNSGDVTLRNVNVTDPLLPLLSCAQASLLPGDTLSCTAPYSVKQNDLDIGSIVNIATVNAIDPLNANQQADDTATNTAQTNAAFSVQKSTTTTPTAAGQTLDYRFSVRNDGNVSIRNITLVDAKCDGAINLQGGDTDGDGELDPVNTHIYACTSVPITQEEVDAGQIDNSVTVSGSPTVGALAPVSAEVSTPIARSSAFNVVKSTSSTPTAADQTLDYSFVVTNTGNASISGITITDAKCAAAPALQSGDTNNDTELGPSETWTYICTSIPVTQIEVDSGSVDNSVTLSGTDPTGAPVTGGDTLETPITATPSFTVDKSTTDTPMAEGDRLTYRFSLVNTGNVSIAGVTFNDPKCSGAVTLTSGDSDNDTVLDVGETHSYQCLSVPVTQAEVDAGSLDNTVTVTGTPAGGILATASDTETTPIAPAPALSLDKRLNATSPTSYSSTSDVLLFEFVVTNTGNVSITQPITITDALLDAPATCPALPVGGLAPGDPVICTGQRTIQQGDIDDGSFTNTATAVSGGTSSAPDQVTVPADQRPSLGLTKSGTEPTPFAVGTVVDYTYVITNTGNVTIPQTAPLVINDNRIPSVTCDPIPAAGILPGGTLACEAEYTVVAEDLALGTVTNNATATDGNVTSPVASVTVPSSSATALSLVKTAQPLPAGFAEAGDEITYEYTLTNTGGAGFTDTINVSDNKINDGAPFACWVPTGADPTLSPDPTYPGGTPPTNTNGETFTCFQTYAVTQEDIDAGMVENEATASTVFAPLGTAISVSSNPATEVVNFSLPATLEIAKVADPVDLTPAAVDDVITYTFTLTNTGEVTLDDAFAVDTGPTFGGVAGTGVFSAFTVTSGPDDNTDGRVDTLGPDEVATITATYTLTQADIDNAAAAADPSVAIANSATASAAPRNGTLDPVTPATATSGFVPAPAFIATKETSSTPMGEGDTLDYTFFVENTGNVSISGITVTDPKCEVAPALQAGDLDGDTVLDVGENWRYTCTSIAVTQTEVDDGSVDNTVTVSGTPAGGTLADITADNSVEIDPNAVLDVAKSTASTPTAAGETLLYRFVLTNAGNVSITPGALDDPKCAATPALQSGDTNGNLAVDPTETWEYTCTSIPVTQDEVNAGVITNTVTVPGTTPAGDPITPPTDRVDTPVTAVPGFTVDKETTSTVNAAEDTLDYTFTVVNTGNVTISNLMVLDPKCVAAPALQSGDTNGNGHLDPPETLIFTCTSIPVTQPEIDSGTVDNTVRVTGNLPGGAPAPEATDTNQVSVTATPSFVLTKDTTSMPVAEGDTLTYDFTLTNTGNVSISAIAIADAKCASGPAIPPTSDVNSDGVLSPNEIWTLSCVSIPVTQTEIDDGEVVNSATAIGSSSGGTLAPALADNTTPVASNPGLAMTKSTDSVPVEEGETLDYLFTVTNTGNTSLMSVAVTDAKCAATPAFQSGDDGDGALNPTETWIYTCTSIPVTQEEVDAGAVLNEATVTASDPGGTPATPAIARNETPIDENGAFSVVKDSVSVITQAGQTLDYTFTLTNDGNVSLSGIVVSDDKCAEAPTLQSGDDNGDEALNPTETFVYICTSIPATQVEIDAGEVNNDVSVTAGTPGGNAVTPATDSDTTPVIPVPGIEAFKTITSSGTALGDTVTFEITVRNTGNVTLRGITVTDTLTRIGSAAPLTFTNPVGFANASFGSQAGTLLPDEVATYRASYVLQQEDIDAGGLSNTATATGNPPTGASVSDISDDGLPGGTDDPTLLPITPLPELSLVKSLEAVVKADSTLAASYDTVGDRLDYLFTVTNEGNVTITDTISIDDPLITGAGGVITCDPGPLAPGDSLECRGSYVVTLPDINAGQRANSATASSPTTPATLPSTVIVPAIQNPAIETTKVARALAPVDFVVGAIATYDYITTNTGNTSITVPITINDNLIPASGITCDPWPGALDPGQTYTCVGTYEITIDDFDLEVVTNRANGVSGPLESPQVTASIPDGAMPALNIAKSSPNTSFAALGDTLTYSFTITNSGNIAFVRPIIVTDNRIGDITCWERDPGVDEEFEASATATCEGIYTVVQEDLDEGFVTNEAFAETLFRASTQVISNVDTVTVSAAAAPLLDLEKTVALPAGRTTETLVPTDVLTYTLSVSNDGNQTLRNITISDSLLGLTCAVAELRPTQSDASCTGTLTLTQDDIDAGEVINTATATGSDPSGGAVSDSDALTTPMPTPAPGLSLIKTANVDPYGPVGTDIVYSFEVQNTGNVTLRDVVVTDADRLPGYTCTLARLLPGQTDTSCSAPYSVIQADVDAGEITNTASATGNDPDGNPVTGTGSVTVTGPSGEGLIEATKTVTFDGTTVGSSVSYQIAIENLGNVTVNDILVVDTMTRADGSSITLDAPGLEFLTGDDDSDDALDVTEIWVYIGKYTLTQADINAGGIRNTATVTGRLPNGTPVNDVADNGDDLDGDDEGDPTVVPIPTGPAIGAVKTVNTSGSQAGQTVSFDIIVRNLGNVDLSNINVSDTLSRLDGTPLATNGPPTFVSGDNNDTGVLNLTEVWTYQVSYTLTQEDIDAGGISNVAIVSGTSGTGQTVTDVADNGDPGDGNVTDDPTVLTIAPAPALDVRKRSTSTVSLEGDTATFVIDVENTGNVTLNSPTIVDTLTRADDTVLALTTGPDFVSATPGSTETQLATGGTLTYAATYTLVQEDVDAGGITNTAIATLSTPGGIQVSDTSDDPDSSATGDSDPTIVTLEPLPSLTSEKAVTGERVLFPGVVEVSFEITVINDGNVTLTDVDVRDDLAAYAAPAMILNTPEFPTTVTVTGLTSGAVNPTYNGVSDTQLLSSGASLAPNQTVVINITTTYEGLAGYPQPGLNTALVTTTELPDAEGAEIVATQVDSDGDGVPDGVESRTEDRDGDGIPDANDYDPTGYFYCEDSGRLLNGGQITVSGNGFSQTGEGTAGPIRILRDGANAEYQFFVSRAGTYTLSYNVPVGTPSTNILATTAPLDVTNVADVLTGSTTSNPRILGSAEFGDTRALADASAAANPAFYTTFVIEAGDPQVFSNNIPFLCGALGDLVASKNVIGQSEVRLGDFVTYQLMFELDGSQGGLRDVRFVDLLPEGISYVPGSARIARNEAEPVALEPVRSGRRLSWPSESMDGGTRTILTFNGRVGPNAPTGKLINKTYAAGPNGAPLSNVAEAVVRRRPEHVFDCSDVIGKVFDDLNRNGYQDEGEPGLPGARVATVNGTLITTDEFGRFHVPCAELPKEIGSNYILKLDERSLPSGYRVTTENPRVIRLTAGKFAKMNFGATLGRVIDINLSGAAFDSGAQASAALQDAVRNLSRTLQAEPSVVRLSYVVDSEAEVKLGRARMRTVEKLLKAEWRRNGTYKLTIEKTIKRRQ